MLLTYNKKTILAYPQTRLADPHVTNSKQYQYAIRELGGQCKQSTENRTDDVELRVQACTGKG